MFKIYKRTLHIGTPENPQPRLEDQIDENSASHVSNILAVSAMLAGAVVGTLVFSVFFAILLIPLGIFRFNRWRRLKSAQPPGVHRTEGDSIPAEYTVISDTDEK